MRLLTFANDGYSFSSSVYVRRVESIGKSILSGLWNITTSQNQFGFAIIPGICEEESTVSKLNGIQFW